MNQIIEAPIYYDIAPDGTWINPIIVPHGTPGSVMATVEVITEKRKRGIRYTSRVDRLTGTLHYLEHKTLWRALWDSITTIWRRVLQKDQP
jgi:hypothetical protein